MEIAPAIIEEYLANLGDAKENTVKSYRKALRTFLKWTEAAQSREISTENIIAFKTALLEEGRRGTTINSYITAIKGLGNYLASKGKIEKLGKIKNVSLPSGHLRDSLTIGQSRQLIALGGTDRESKRNAAITRVMLSGGLRTCEVARANYEDYTQKGGKTVLFIQGKGKDTREDFIVISPETQRVIDDYIASRGNTIKDKEPLFKSEGNHTSNNGRMKPESISRIIKKELKSIGVINRRITAHSLRHTAITLSLLGGCDIRETQTLARHSSVMTTEKYAHDIDKLSGKAVSSIENMLSGGESLSEPAALTLIPTEVIE